MKSKSAASKSAGDKKSQADLAGGLKDLSMEEKITVKSKNLDVLAEYNKSKRKKSANFVVIGRRPFNPLVCESLLTGNQDMSTLERVL
jgi:hypothetical protein